MLTQFTKSSACQRTHMLMGKLHVHLHILYWLFLCNSRTSVHMESPPNGGTPIVLILPSLLVSKEQSTNFGVDLALFGGFERQVFGRIDIDSLLEHFE